MLTDVVPFLADYPTVRQLKLHIDKVRMRLAFLTALVQLLTLDNNVIAIETVSRATQM